MAELVPQQGGNEGYIPNTQATIFELYRLMAIFFSSKKFAELRTGNGERFDPITKIELGIEDEITRILLAIAITARVIDDRAGHGFNIADASCGTLVRNTANVQLINLDLREACNKIIHAERVHFDVDETEALQPYLQPFIYLYGHQHNNEWKATIDVIEFAKTYVTCVNGL